MKAVGWGRRRIHLQCMLLVIEEGIGLNAADKLIDD